MSKVTYILSSMLAKNKVLGLSSLLLTTSVVCPLTSCGSDGLSNDIGGFDKEFGFDVQTYNRLENEFINKYKNQLLNDNTINKNAFFDKYDNFLQNDISIMRNHLFDPAQNYSYTIRTNALMDYAFKNYGIDLTRNTSISDVEYTKIKAASLENFSIYLDNVYGVDDTRDKNAKIVNFSRNFDALLNDITSKYTDKADVLMKLRSSVINCWEDLDVEFAHISAFNHLKDFFDDYEFIVKDQTKNSTDSNELLWDNLLFDADFITNGNTGLIGDEIDCPITDEWINKLFTIVKKKNHKEDNSSNQQLVSLSNIPISYSEIYDFNSQKIIPGFILTPVLKVMSQDVYANEYYMNIDWQLISNKYINEEDQEIKNEAIAHLTYDKDGQIVDADLKKQVQSLSLDYQFTKYSFFATPTCQKHNLINAYFNSPINSISLSWDKKIVGIESFLPSDAYNNSSALPNEPYNLAMSQDNLSKIGLQLNNTNLSSLINNQSTNDDSDENLKIEEKFAKYCTISAVSTVEFYDDNNTNDNKIQNAFTVTYKNTNQECKINDNQEKTTLTKLSPSSVFDDNAVLFYNTVNGYINTQFITDTFASTVAKSLIIISELAILTALILIWIALVVWQACTKLFNEDYDKHRLITHPIRILIFMLALIVCLWVIWYFCVHKPIDADFNKSKNWNQAFANGLADKINVVRKVRQDQQHFATSDSFSEYFKNNKSEAFARYFYYLHFNKFLNEPLNVRDEEVSADYKQFQDTKIGIFVTLGTDDAILLFASIALAVIIILTFIIVATIWYDYLNVNKQLRNLGPQQPIVNNIDAGGDHDIVQPVEPPEDIERNNEIEVKVENKDNAAQQQLVDKNKVSEINRDIKKLDEKINANINNEENMSLINDNINNINNEENMPYNEENMP